VVKEEQVVQERQEGQEDQVVQEEQVVQERQEGQEDQVVKEEQGLLMGLMGLTGRVGLVGRHTSALSKLVGLARIAFSGMLRATKEGCHAEEICGSADA
jgi:hypothetical protein